MEWLMTNNQLMIVCISLIGKTPKYFSSALGVSSVHCCCIYSLYPFFTFVTFVGQTKGKINKPFVDLDCLTGCANCNQAFHIYILPAQLLQQQILKLLGLE